MQKLILSDRILQINSTILQKNNYNRITHELLNDMYSQDNKVFDNLFRDNDYPLFLENSIRKVFDILVSDLPYCYKRVLLYDGLELDFNQELTSYILSLYATGSNKAYSDFSTLFYVLIQKLRIYPFYHYSEQEVRRLMRKYFDFEQNDDRTIIVNKKVLNEEKYNQFFTMLESGNDIDGIVYKQNSDLLFAYSEYELYLDLLNKYQNDPTNHILWLSRDYGDGFGCDFLVYNNYIKKEKMIELKSGYNYYVSLTRNEYRTLKNTRMMDNSDYLIRKIRYFPVPWELVKSCENFKYDKEKDILFSDPIIYPKKGEEFVIRNKEYYELFPTFGTYFKNVKDEDADKVIYLVKERKL